VAVHYHRVDRVDRWRSRERPPDQCQGLAANRPSGHRSGDRLRSASTHRPGHALPIRGAPSPGESNRGVRQLALPAPRPPTPRCNRRYPNLVRIQLPEFFSPSRSARCGLLVACGLLSVFGRCPARSVPAPNGDRSAWSRAGREHRAEGCRRLPIDSNSCSQQLRSSIIPTSTDRAGLIESERHTVLVVVTSR